ncbi:MAG: YicC/YloC family endoribonuclease, partial [Brevinematia bacterium]
MNGMTGFSYISKELDFGRLTISLRSLNSRFLEIKTTLPPIIQKIEPKLRSYLKENFRRGKIELFIELHLRKQINQVTIDEELAKNYFMSMKKISNKLGLLPDIEIVDVIKMPNVLSIIPPLDPPEEIIREVEKYTKTAINEVKKQRQREGEETKEDIEELIKKLEENILEIDE